MISRFLRASCLLGGAAFLASACGAYPARTFPQGDASVGASGSAGSGGQGTAGDMSGTGGDSSGAGGDSSGMGGTSNTGGGDASSAGGSAGSAGGAPVADAAVDSGRGDAQVEASVPGDCTLPGAHPGLDCRCADGTVEDVFSTTMVGCADKPGGTLWAERAKTCGPACRACTALEWINGRGAKVPTENYWTNDNLQPQVGNTAATCSAVVYSGVANMEPCLGHPMHVCKHSADTGSVKDDVGATCTMHDCGLEHVPPNLYFGGCADDRTAGTLCCCP